MKILMINKFLHKNGGAETYVFKLGDCLERFGNEVQYFGMDHEDRIKGNQAEVYTTNLDFHNLTFWNKLICSFKTIYSVESMKKIRLVLDSFQPNVCHLNNFNYQLTPSVILAIKKWCEETGKQCKIIYTAHDYQLVCPNHMCHSPKTDENCEKCLDRNFINCARNKCIHKSITKSVVGVLEAYFWKFNGAYEYIDTMICCSEFLKSKLDKNPIFAQKTITIHNFIDSVEWTENKKKDYVLYFGRFSEEKGITTLINACKSLPEINFIFAGTGPLENEINKIINIKNVGFKTGKELETLIREARFSVYPSEWYENCPFSVMESQMYGTPVLGANIGGIPELIKLGVTGELFESGNEEELKSKILCLWNNRELTNKMSENCKETEFDTIEAYCEKVLQLYS